MSEYSRSPFWKDLRNGGWLIVVLIVIHGITLETGIYLSQIFRIPGDGPGQVIPWYFIRRDFIEGICRAVEVTVCLLLGLLVWHRYRRYARMLIFLPLLFSGYAIWKLGVILLRTKHVMNPQLAQSSWPSFDAYFNDRLIWTGLPVVLLTGVAVSFLIKP